MCGRLFCVFLFRFPQLAVMYKKISLVVLFAVLPFSLLAWGVEGHRVIGKIAENHLSKKARAQV